MPDAASPEKGPYPLFNWGSLPLRLALASVPLWLTVAVLVFQSGWRIKLIVGIVFGVTLAAPAQGLLLTALLAPLGQLIASIIGADDFRLSEAMVVAFLAGWLVRGLEDREGPRVPAPGAAWLCAATIVAWIGRTAWPLHGHPSELRSAIDHVVRAYYLAGDRLGIVEGAGRLEGLALVVATMMLFRRRPRLAETLPIVIATSGVAAAAARVPMDANAARGYFAMVVALTLGMTLRARGRRRAAWAAASLAIGVGFWLAWTGSIANRRSSFAQIAAELGLVGLGALLVWIGAAVARSGRALLLVPDDSRLLGITAGVVILLGACIVSTPLAVDEAAFPFWIQFGLMTALAGSTLLTPAAPRAQGV